MSYNDVAEMQQSLSLRNRLTAAAAQEGKPVPESWVFDRLWILVSTPGWEAAWASARANNQVDPRHDEGVITDGMILSAVQPLA